MTEEEILKNVIDEQVAQQAGIADYVTVIPPQGKAQVLIDNRCHTYSQIVETIATRSRKGLNFHIYSEQNQLIITPKMH